MSDQLNKQRVLVALSGGVDSAVAAKILIDQGHEVSAVYVRTWEYEDDLLGDCPGAKDLKDAESVAEKLKIQFDIVNFVDFYHQEVVQPMVQGYAEGITPNPDILCNKQMKFGALMEYAKEHGFDALATGHYCIRRLGPNHKPELWEGKDKNKDQSYFLARLTPKQLQYALFPIGLWKKPDIRNFACEAGLPVAAKKDSQGICFLGKVKVPQFLSHFIEDKPGDILDTSGKKLGRHLGLHRYTLGQRKGIGIPSNTDFERYVVTGKNESSNELIVAFDRPDEATLWSRTFGLDDVFFLDSSYENEKRIQFQGKARYRDLSTPIMLYQKNPNKWIAEFEEPQRALTPGQVLAFYKGERLVGSGFYSHNNLGRAAISS